VISTGSAEYYEELWQTARDDMKKYGPFSRHYRRIILQLVRPLEFTTALDIGCGEGSLLAGICALRPEVAVSGMDISDSALRLARRRLPDGEFWNLDITKQHLGRRFDLILCSEVLEHLDDDVAALQNIARMTTGHVIISSVQGHMRQFEKQIGHVRNYRPGELVQKVERVGLSTTQVIEWGFPFYSPLYRDFLNLVGGKGTTGQFGPFRRVISAAIYALFCLNTSRRGDEIFVVAKHCDDSHGPCARVGPNG
jgi:SAM-dependent methyltransferase